MSHPPEGPEQPNGPEDGSAREPGTPRPARPAPPPMPASPPSVGVPRVPPPPGESGPPTQPGLPARQPYGSDAHFGPPGPPAAPAPPTPAVRSGRRTRLLITGVAVVVAVALVAVLAVVLTRDDDKGDGAAGSAGKSSSLSPTSSATSTTSPSGSAAGSGSKAPVPPGGSPSGTAIPGSPTWSKAASRGYLVVGAKDDQPGLGAVDPATGSRVGFDIEMARLIATRLGFDPGRTQYKTVSSANREAALRNGDIDFYIGTYSITDQRKQTVAFAGPYYVSGLGVLVRSTETAITGINSSVNGRTLCTALGSTPEAFLRLNFPQAGVVGRASYADCLQELQNGYSDAVATDDAILKGYAAARPGELKVVGAPVTTEKYGVGMAHDDAALRAAVNGVIEQAIADGTWKKLYDRTLGLADAPQPTVPTVERY